jgi:transcription factor S
MFCPKCKSLLRPKKEKDKTVLVCGCGYSSEGELKLTESKKPDLKQDFRVVDSSQDKLPVVDAECSKCKHVKAEFWIVQTRAADEAPTRFFRCEKCRHTWREYK